MLARLVEVSDHSTHVCPAPLSTHPQFPGGDLFIILKDYCKPTTRPHPQNTTSPAHSGLVGVANSAQAHSGLYSVRNSSGNASVGCVHASRLHVQQTSHTVAVYITCPAPRQGRAGQAITMLCAAGGVCGDYSLWLLVNSEACGYNVCSH